MLTVLAWIVFVPAIIWNFMMFIVIFVDFIDDRSIDMSDPYNIRYMVISLSILFIPGIYLFGVF